MPPRRHGEHVVWRHATYLHDVRQLVDLGLSWEDGVARVQLSNDATEAPHVNAHSVRYTQDDLGSAVEPRLDVRVDALVDEARAAEVNDLDAALVLLLEQDVLWLEVAVDDAEVLLVLQGLQNLDGEAADQAV